MEINCLKNKPIAYFTKSKDNIWTDPHISKQMLEAHLASSQDGATRNKKFVEESVQWLTESFPPKNFPNLLDLGCGPGIYAEQLQQQGFQVSGIDFSLRSITYAKQSALKNRLAINYSVRNYLHEDLGEEKYDLILMIYCDLGVLTPEERTLLFRKIQKALKKKGKFIFDVFTAERYKNFKATKNWTIEENSFWSSEACLHLQENQAYSDTNTYLESHWLIYEDHFKEFFIWENTFTVENLVAEVSHHSFDNIDTFSDVRGVSLDSKSETVCLVCTKS